MYDESYALSCAGLLNTKQDPEPVSDGLETVPPETLKAMQDYAKKLKKNSPKMSEARVTRKVCEKFKVKLT